jgi:hypothetical protein
MAMGQIVAPAASGAVKEAGSTHVTDVDGGLLMTMDRVVVAAWALAAEVRIAKEPRIGD